MLPNINKVKLFWVFVILFGFSLGTYIIIRDANNGFGTVTFGPTNDFNFVSENGSLFSSKKLSGKVWIGHGVTTDCIKSDECESYIEMYASIHESLKDNDDVTMISFVDGDESNLAIIESEYPSKSDKWKFLHTPKSEFVNIQRYQNRRSENAFIVDQNGIIRGIYNIQSIKEVKKLIKDIKKLI